MSNAEDTNKNAAADPSPLAGHLNQIKGAAYQAVGSATGSAVWADAGARAQADGADELDAARRAAERDRLHGKAQSALGMLTGNQDKQSEGNMRAEGAEWTAAAARGELPSVSAERAKGKFESAVGMATGNQEKQKEGNVRAEKAEWTQG